MIAILSTATPAAGGGSAATADTGRTGGASGLGRSGTASRNGAVSSGADAGPVGEQADGFDVALDALVDQPDQEITADSRGGSEQQPVPGSRRATGEWWLRTFNADSTATGAAITAGAASAAVSAGSAQTAASEAAEGGDEPIELNESAPDGSSASAVPDGRTDIVADAWMPPAIPLPDVAVEQPSEAGASPDGTAEQPLPAYTYGDVAASRYASTSGAEAPRSGHAGQMVSEAASPGGAEVRRSDRAGQAASEAASLPPTATLTVTPTTLAESTVPVADDSASADTVKAEGAGDLERPARAESRSAETRRDTHVTRMLAQRISEVAQSASPLESATVKASDAASSSAKVTEDAAVTTSGPATTASQDNVRRAKSFDDLSSPGVLSSSTQTAEQAHANGGESTGNGHSDHQRRELAAAVKQFAGSTKVETTSTPASFTVTVGAQGTTQVAAAASPTLSSATAVQLPQEAENLSRLVQSMRVLAREGGSEATIRLNPAQLGEVTISIRVEGGSVSASVQAESGSVRQWLQAQEDTIRGTLAGQGLDLKQFSVEPDAQQQSQDDQRDQAREQQRRRRATKADTTTFEVTA